MTFSSKFLNRIAEKPQKIHFGASKNYQIGSFSDKKSNSGLNFYHFIQFFIKKMGSVRAYLRYFTQCLFCSLFFKLAS